LTSCELLQRPRNTVVLRGQSAVLHCRTDTTTSADSTAAALSWKFTSVDGTVQKFIYNDNGLNPAYSRRNINVRINETLGEYQLVFGAIDLDDAGTYTCQDGGGIGEAHAAWIAVLGLFMLRVLFTDHNAHRHHPFFIYSVSRQRKQKLRCQ